MYVIKGTLPTNTIGTHAATVEHLLPVAMCVSQVDASRSHTQTVTVAHYILNGTPVAVTDPILGHLDGRGIFMAGTVL